MSRSIDLFIECPKPIEEVASEVARLTGMDLQPSDQPGTWSLDEQGVHAELRAHPYVDDGDLMLRRYQYALSSHVSNGTRLADSAEAALLRLVSEALRKVAVPSLLVHDLQYRDAPKSGAAGGDAPAPVDAS